MATPRGIELSVRAVLVARQLHAPPRVGDGPGRTERRLAQIRGSSSVPVSGNTARTRLDQLVLEPREQGVEVGHVGTRVVGRELERLVLGDAERGAERQPGVVEDGEPARLGCLVEHDLDRRRRACDGRRRGRRAAR